MSNPIGWCTKTWNPMTGCTPVSEACEHCWARVQRNRGLQKCPNCAGRGEVLQFDGKGYYACCACGGSGRWRDFAPRFRPDRLDIPLHWRKPQRIFVCSMSDLFHEAFTGGQVASVLNTVWCSHEARLGHTFIVLTKRPERARLLNFAPPPNVWLGVTVENQAHADERIPVLLDTPAAVRFVCCEPFLGPVDLESEWGQGVGDLMIENLDWVIVGGENGPGARPMQPEWALAIYRQCKAAGVPFWFKGWGSAFFRAPHVLSHEEGEMTQTQELPATP